VAAVAARCDRRDAVRLANLEAGIKVGKRGSVSVSLQELEQSVREENGGVWQHQATVQCSPGSPVTQGGTTALECQVEMSRETEGEDAS